MAKQIKYGVEARKALEKIGVTNINPALPARH